MRTGWHQRPDGAWLTTCCGALNGEPHDPVCRTQWGRGAWQPMASHSDPLAQGTLRCATCGMVVRVTEAEPWPRIRCRCDESGDWREHFGVLAEAWA